MAELNNYVSVNISDICIYERAKKGKIYKAGCFCIQVSATRGQTFYLKKDMEVDSRYLVFELIDSRYDSRYVYLVFKDNLRDFLKKIQTGLNILPCEFEKYIISLHQDIKTQKQIADIMFEIDKRIEDEEKMINQIKDFKKYHLSKMFCKK